MDLNGYKDAIAKAAPDRQVELLAVSKGQSESAIRRLYSAGQRVFGESYVQELAKKAEALADLDLRWVFIGRLQGNKIAKVVQYADEVQSLAEVKHARLLSRHALAAGKSPLPIYLQVNLGNEMQKAGLQLSELPAFLTEIKDLNLEVRGLMAIPPKLSSSAVPESYYSLAHQARSVGQGRLSLGMSGDWPQALAAGSDVVRLGRALFASYREVEE